MNRSAVLLSLALASVLMAQTSAIAQTAPSTAGANSAEGTSDIDQEITNARIRADSGSKSKFSLSVKTTYTGGSLTNAFGARRPLLSAEPGLQDFTSLDFGLNGRYRWSKNDSMTVGTAFGFVTPFQGRVSTKDAVNVNDPNVAYSRVGTFFGLQSSGTILYAYGTSLPSLAIDETHQFALAYNVIKSFQNGVAVGASVSTGYNVFSSRAGENSKTHSTTYGGDKRTEYYLGFYPQAEYAFSSTLSARTVFGYFNWRHLYGDDNHYRMLQTYVYQSIGVGIAVTRDIYLYPNIQFVPDNIRSDFTNVALSSSINIF